MPAAVLAMLLGASLSACAPASPAASEPGSQPAGSQPLSGSPTATTPAPAGEPLEQVLAFLTLDTTTVTFTDWTAIKAAAGGEDLTGASSKDDRLAFMLPLGTRLDVLDPPLAFIGASGYLQEGLLTYWSFDTPDLAWEAELNMARGRVNVLRFRDDFDLAAVAAHFDERDYSTETLAGATLRSNPMSTREEWLLRTDIGFANVAFLPDGHTLVLSADRAQIAAVLSTDAPLPALRSAAVLRDAVAALEQPTAAYLSFDLDRTCQPRPPAAQQAAVDALLTQAGLLHPYTLLAIGNRGALSPPGRLVFGYTDATDAVADLAGRELLARDGITLRQGLPLGAAIFTYVDGAVNGGTLTLRVDAPQLTTPLPSGSGVPALGPFLFRSLFASELLFAACDMGA
jgi:hypothetical protein